MDKQTCNQVMHNIDGDHPMNREDGWAALSRAIIESALESLTAKGKHLPTYSKERATAEGFFFAEDSYIEDLCGLAGLILEDVQAVAHAICNKRDESEEPLDIAAPKINNAPRRKR